MLGNFLSPTHYEVYGQYNGNPSEAQLARYFYLDDFDREQMSQGRKSARRLGFALQLTSLRFLGTYPQDLSRIPTVVFVFIADQLDIKLKAAKLKQYSESQGFWTHQRQINQIYGYRLFHALEPSYQFLRWLYTRAWLGSERPSVLFDLSIAWLIDHKILLPGITVLERLIIKVRERTEQRSWRLINAQLTPNQKKRANQLVKKPDSEFDQLREMPSHISSPQIRYHLDRLEALRSYELHTLDLSKLSRHRLQTLADYALTAPTSRLRRLQTERKTAVIVAGMTTLAVRIQDLVIDMLEQWLQETSLHARNKFEKERLKSLSEFDQAAIQLRDFADYFIALPDHQSLTIAQLFQEFRCEQIQSSIATIDKLKRPENSGYRSLMLTRYPSARRFLPSLLRLITFRSVTDNNPVLAALNFLQKLDQDAAVSLQDAPRAVISTTWKSLVIDKKDQLERDAYTICVLQELMQKLRHRDLYIKPSERWYDPRQYLIEISRWQVLKPQICRLLDRKPDPEPELKSLRQALDEAYQQTNAALLLNPHLRMEVMDEISRPVLSPLDPHEPSPEHQLLENALTKRLPAVDLPDLMLEVHQMTSFADAFTHVSEGKARIEDLAISICAFLLAEACNIGLEAVIDENIPALSRTRLVWVQQNYMRPDPLAEANRWLVQAQSRLRIAQLWGGGEIASADGLRFVVPQRALHGGFNRKYFGSGRGVTFFNFMSDQFTGFHHIVIPGTLKEALFILDGLLDQQSPLQPTEIMTDTNSYTDIVFGLFWLLGFQFSPRLADIKDRRFWRMERDADYGAFNAISKHKISTTRLHLDWDDMLRTAGSLKIGDLRPSQLLRIFSTSSGSSSLSKSIRDLGRIAKTLHMLHYIRDETYQRRILTQLNHTELRHKLARRLCYGNRGELRHSYKEGQEEQLGALGLLLNLVVYWNTFYLDRALTELLQLHPDIDHDDLARITPLAYDHIRILGRYSFTLNPHVQLGNYRPLKPLHL